jgi:hypothetical protein
MQASTPLRSVKNHCPQRLKPHQFCLLMYGLNRLRKNSGPGRKDVPQGLKPNTFLIIYARLKSCPDTKQCFSAACEARTLQPIFIHLGGPIGPSNSPVRMTKGRAALPWRAVAEQKHFHPFAWAAGPLTAPFGMTNLLYE